MRRCGIQNWPSEFGFTFAALAHDKLDTWESWASELQSKKHCVVCTGGQRRLDMGIFKSQNDVIKTKNVCWRENHIIHDSLADEGQC